MTAYDIRAALRTLLEETDLSDPGDIAERLAKEVPGNSLRPVLAAVLRPWVRGEFHLMPRRPSPEPMDTRNPRHRRSAKVAAYQRDAYAYILRKPVAVESNVWKPFGQCTTDDLAYLAADRRENAAESIAAAERFEKYAAAMDESGAETVADLSDEAIASIEDGAQ